MLHTKSLLTSTSPCTADTEDEASQGSESTTASRVLIRNTSVSSVVPGVMVSTRQSFVHNTQALSYPEDMLRPRTREIAHPAALDGVKSRAEELNFHTNDHGAHILSVDSWEMEHQRRSLAEPVADTLACQQQLDSTSSESSVVVSRCTRGEQKSARASIMSSYSQTGVKQQEVRVNFFPKTVPTMSEQSTWTREGRSSAVLERSQETTEEQTATSADVATASDPSTVALAAVAAPILKAQSDLEAKMTTVAELLASLQGQLERSKEERPTRDTECQDHPPEHLQRFIEKQLAFLEKLQTQQLHLQNHLLGKTSVSGILPSLSNPASEELDPSRTAAAFPLHGKEVLTRTKSTRCSEHHVRFSSLVDPCQEGPDTPSPRGVAPQPIPWAGRTTEGLPANPGKKPAISAVSVEVSEGAPGQQIGEYRGKQSTPLLAGCLLMSTVDHGLVQRTTGPTPSTFLTSLERGKPRHTEDSVAHATNTDTDTESSR